MNTIMICEKDLDTIVNYECARYFDCFVFNEFRIIVKQEDYKTVYKIRVNGDINEVVYRMIKDGEFYDCEFSYRENEEWNKKEGKIEYIKEPKGELVNRFKPSILDMDNNSSMDTDEINTIINKKFMAIVRFICMIKQYIMNKSYEREMVQKEVKSVVKSVSKSKGKANENKNQNEIFLLDDIIEYVTRSGRHHTYSCEAWGVRGHFRHYKSGKVVWISEYEKGTKRNTGFKTTSKTYII